jgi:hypothetical protein
MQLDDRRIQKTNQQIGQPHTFDFRKGLYYCEKCGAVRRIVGDDVSKCSCGEAAFCLTVNIGVLQI